MPNISIILATLTTFTTMGQTENEKMGSDMSISSEVPVQDTRQPTYCVYQFRLVVAHTYKRIGMTFKSPPFDKSQSSWRLLWLLEDVLNTTGGA